MSGTNTRDYLAYCESIQPELNSICKPAFEFFGVRNFHYNRFFDGDKALVFGSFNQWSKEYFNHDLDKYLWFSDTSILSKKESRVIWKTSEDDNNELLVRMKNHDIDNGLSIYRRKDSYVESWHFSTNRENCNVVNLYVKDFDKLNRFIHYFTQKADHLINNPDPVALLPYSNGLSLTLPPMEASPEEKWKKFLEATDLKGHTCELQGKSVRLTKREVECLSFLSRGCTSKEIGAALGLSSRSIEKYIERIKDKTEMRRISQILMWFQTTGVQNWSISE